VIAAACLAVTPAVPVHAADTLGAPFSTRHAHFEPKHWADLPGWSDDNLSEAWEAFRQSCVALRKRNAWSGLCQQSSATNAASNEFVREFFEREFFLYQINDVARSQSGVITGYYEPLLRGSRRYGPPYVHPIYAIPDDMLFLDVRRLPEAVRGKPVAVRIEGRNVVPLGGTPTAAPGQYTLDVGSAVPDVRDKKLRLRVEGERLVPYYTRLEIEGKGLARAKVLLWVDDPLALYSMQIQGAGKIRFVNGEIARLAYAEQNGHPFVPPVAAATPSTGTRPRLRGISERSAEGDSEAGAQAFNRAAIGLAGTEATGDEGGQEPRLRSLGGDVPRPGGTQSAQGEKVRDAQVDRVVEELLAQGRLPAKTKANAGRPESGAEIPPELRPDHRSEARPTARPDSSSKATRPPVVSTSAPDEIIAPPRRVPEGWVNTDPSYVFFREIPDSQAGPIGALGIPLTAGRSMAVDPRTTPLGFPVFVSTTRPGRSGALNRLMMAQDTGGAIRGAIRGDYFWGFGASAGAQASRMKETGQMWLLIPKSQEIAAREEGIRLRSIGGRPQTQAECVVADPELCVEDAVEGTR
jgi:membrane-bound lytic murein transglycosylase A